MRKRWWVLAAAAFLAVGAGLVTYTYMPWHEGWECIVVDGNFQGAHDVVLCDVDGDGKPDLVADAFRAGRVVWYKQPSDPVTGKWIQYVIDGNLPNAHDSQVGDIDGDGGVDVVSVSLSEDPKDYKRGNGSVVWYQRPAAPTGPWTKTVIASHSGLTGARSLGLGDIDRDGNLDIAVAVDDKDRGPTGKLYWYGNPGKEAALDPGRWREHLIDDAVNNGADAQVGDLDKDGRPDIVFCCAHLDANPWGVVIYFGGADPARRADWQRVGFSKESAYHAEIVDLDGDSHLDILVAGWKSQKVSWYRNPYPRDVRNPANWREYVIDRRPRVYCANRILARDMDGDGALDIAVCSDPSMATGFFLWYRRPAEPTDVTAWEGHVIEDRPSYTAWAHDADVADIDGDGYPDMAGVGASSHNVLWWRNPFGARTGLVKSPPGR